MANKVNSNSSKKNNTTKTDSSVSGILAKLWKLVIYEGNLHKLLRFYLDKYANRGGTRSKSTIHGYFNADGMTWKTFMFLIFEILPVKKMRITIELTMVNDSKSAHTVTVTSDEFADMNEEEKDIFNHIFEKDINEGNTDDNKSKKKK
jgi:hypothetical protein